MAQKDYYTYFIYRHIREDTNEVFYVGRGKAYARPRRLTQSRTNSYYERYYRAFNKHQRNRIWKSIVAKTDFEAEIIFESDSFEIICQKEIEFISLYGRKDLGEGTLANLSDGGDGPYNTSKESIELGKATAIKNGHYEKMRNERVLPMCIYDKQGKFIKKFENKYDCAKYIQRSYHTINVYIRQKELLNGYIISREFNMDGIDISDYKELRQPKVAVEKIVNGEVVATYAMIKDAVKYDKTYQNAIARSINTGKPVNGILWRKQNLN